MKKLQELRKSRKGFTLVEIIVVLVILAILAAFTIPAMLGFVQDAQKKAEIAQAREVYVACQSAASELAASGKSTTTTVKEKADTLITGDAKTTYTVTLTGDKNQTVQTIVYTGDHGTITIDKTNGTSIK